ncbi:MAG: energy transducer TonB [Terriglobales bacterium]
MPNQESLRYAVNAPFQSSSLAVPGRPRTGGEHAAPQRLRAKPEALTSAGPDAIWGHYNNYRKNGLAVSAVVHFALISLIVVGTLFRPQVVQVVQPRPTVTLIAPSPDSYALPTSKKEVAGGGGGGEHLRLPATKGRLPKFAMRQIVKPQIVVRNEAPKLPVEPTVVVPPQLRLAENHMPNLGNPAAIPLPSAPPSNGYGSGGGIGSGSGGGVGVGHGAGVGPGTGGGIGGGVFKVGGGISAPRPIATPDPQYTEEARQAKTQGTCILWLIVDTEGRPRDIRVVHGLGYGLEAKAIEAVKQWRFQPAMKDGKPVNVEISVEVGFRLY